MPTFVAEYESAWNTTTTPKVVSTTTAVADALVMVGVGENEANTLATPTGGTGLTWTLRQSIVVTDYCSVYLWTAIATTAETFNLSVARTGPSYFGWNCTRWSGVSGIGVSNKANVSGAAPSLSLAGTAAGSSVVVGLGDWNAADGTTRTWRSVNGTPATERTYFRDSVHYATYVGTHDTTGPGGTLTLGLSAPAAQKYSIAAVELLGAAAAATSSPLIHPARRLQPILAR